MTIIQLFQRKIPYEQQVNLVYQKAFFHSREARFYQDYDVPDTLDGRFDLLLLHIFIVMNRLIKEQENISPDHSNNKGEDIEVFMQSLFDMTFIDMDQSLRQEGVGDMGVSKHIKRMMKAFNGRMNAYQAAYLEDMRILSLENSQDKDKKYMEQGTHEANKDNKADKCGMRDNRNNKDKKDKALYFLHSQKGFSNLRQVLIRNVYAKEHKENIKAGEENSKNIQKSAQKLLEYTIENIEYIQKQEIPDLLKGNIQFLLPENLLLKKDKAAATTKRAKKATG